MRRVLWAAALMALVLAGCVGRWGALSQTLGVDLSAGVLRSEYDDHGGFHGDGRAYLELGFTEAEAAALEGAMGESSRWRGLPMSESLRRAAEEAMPGEGEFNSLTSAERGYYCFIDRHGEAVDPQNEGPLWGRHSLNFTLAVYDSARRTLYYVALDT